MNLSAAKTILVTGASGGLGTHITLKLAQMGAKLALVAFPGTGLEELAKKINAEGGQAVFLATDLANEVERHRVVDFVHEKLGNIDILINNAGIEFTSDYHDLSEQDINKIIAVNLVAPMILSRLILPEMLQRKQGHIVNISSLAGKAGPACQEPYAATKAGLVAFTASLRATYYGTGVSASVICPGFVEAGIYAKLKRETGYSAPALLGTSKPEAVVAAVIRAINSDLPEVIVNGLPVRPLFATTALFPRLGEFLTRKTGAHEFFKKIAATLKAENQKR
jgi:short-subunit dehydrogenase